MLRKALGTLLLALAAENADRLEEIESRGVDVFVVDATGGREALVIADELRRHGISVERAFGGRSMKSQLKVADRSGAGWAIIVGSQELEAGVITLRDLRATGDGDRQCSVPRTDVVDHIVGLLRKSDVL